jgi:hypothetical protein
MLSCMPNGVYPVPRNLNQLPAAALRLRVRLSRLELDDRLAQGADPSSSLELRLRAAQLLDQRAELASAVERSIGDARRATPVFSARVPLRRAEMLECAGDLAALAERLRHGGPADVRGVAMARVLLTDGTSPLYLKSDVSLRYSVRAARLALDPLGEAVEDVRVAA